jgi:exodeoxyribonuclease-3
VPLLIVGDGKALTMIDYQVRQVQRWPIGNSPLGALLNPSKDVARFAKLLPTADSNVISLQVRDPKHPEYGTITMIFVRNGAAPGGLQLDSWVALDSQNKRTTIRLHGLHRHLEHQFRPPAHRSGRPLPDRAGARRAVPAGDQVRRAPVPARSLRTLGYVHRAVHGQKGYHGVATVSRIPLRELTAATTGRPMARRAMSGWNCWGRAGHGAGKRLYPRRRRHSDREANPKFGQKLDFLERMTRWSDSLDRPTLLVGDFNIAPLECDVYDHKALLKVVSHTPIEVEALGRLADAHGWVDLGRKHIPAPERNWTWWSYRTYWQEKDRGRRLDHMWASPDLAAQSAGTALSRRRGAGNSRATTSR